MSYSESEARKLVAAAGLKLNETGLSSRTWGNISARISDTEFVITPSGIAYDMITPDMLAKVNIKTRRWEGPCTPSDETGMHADAYLCRKNVDFCIHTHQRKATVVGARATGIKSVPDEYREILGNSVPCASYGLPSTELLCRNVKKAAATDPSCKSVLMLHHGTLCMGRDEADAFNIALTLEKLCEQIIEKNYLILSGNEKFDLYDMLSMYLERETEIRSVVPVLNELPDIKRTDKNIPDLYKAVFRSYPDVNFIGRLTDPYTTAVSMAGKELFPSLDDMSQIAGVSMRVFENDPKRLRRSQNALIKSLSYRNAVLVKNGGAIVTAKTESDIKALKEVVSKGCETQIGHVMFSQGEPLQAVYRKIMRIAYLSWYTKKH